VPLFAACSDTRPEAKCFEVGQPDQRRLLPPAANHPTISSSSSRGSSNRGSTNQTLPVMRKTKEAKEKALIRACFPEKSLTVIERIKNRFSCRWSAWKQRERKWFSLSI